ncbi:hypothetical protein [Lolliginicoccus suaedae]|uniref:hypothetical protein n=1 Tax=Lolliginicoccus suaedae TaxID=2605429 RepID=UPI0011ECF317|nr:hypothetical protein [Lolliginicoccus suaedae]
MNRPTPIPGPLPGPSSAADPAVAPRDVENEIQQLLQQIDATTAIAGAGQAGMDDQVALFEQAHAILVEALSAIDDV